MYEPHILDMPALVPFSITAVCWHIYVFGPFNFYAQQYNLVYISGQFSNTDTLH